MYRKLTENTLVEEKMSSLLGQQPFEEDLDSGRTVWLTCLLIIFSLLFVVAMVLNTLFLIIIARKSSIRTVSNRFIISLTMSNILTACVLLSIIATDFFMETDNFISDANKVSVLIPIIERISITSGDLELMTVPSPTLESNSFDNRNSLLNKQDDLNIIFTSETPTPFYDIQPRLAMCMIFSVGIEFVTSSAVFATLLIAIDRYFAITDPLHYYSSVTKLRSNFMIASGWILASCFTIASCWFKSSSENLQVCNISKNNESHEKSSTIGSTTFSYISLLVCFAIPLFLLCAIYAKIYECAQQNSERARKSSLKTDVSQQNLEVLQNMRTVSRSSSTRSTSSQIVYNIRRRISNASLFLYREESRAAKISIAVIALFIVSWMPYYVLQVSQVSSQKGSIKEWMEKGVLLFPLVNCVLSPYIYIFRSKVVITEVYRLFGIDNREKYSQYACDAPTSSRGQQSVLDKAPSIHHIPVPVHQPKVNFLQDLIKKALKTKFVNRRWNDKNVGKVAYTSCISTNSTNSIVSNQSHLLDVPVLELEGKASGKFLAEEIVSSNCKLDNIHSRNYLKEENSASSLKRFFNDSSPSTSLLIVPQIQVNGEVE